jgi:hypothetical protein
MECRDRGRLRSTAVGIIAAVIRQRDIASGINTLTIQTTGKVDGAVSMTGAQNTVTNSGTMNSLLTMDGTNLFTNNAGAVLHGTYTGGSGVDTVDNSGTINGSANTGAGDDFVYNRANGVIQGVNRR